MMQTRLALGLLIMEMEQNHLDRKLGHSERQGKEEVILQAMKEDLEQQHGLLSLRCKQRGG
eukprot:473047-Hanusia_phi.AAC.1